MVLLCPIAPLVKQNERSPLTSMLLANSLPSCIKLDDKIWNTGDQQVSSISQRLVYLCFCVKESHSKTSLIKAETLIISLAQNSEVKTRCIYVFMHSPVIFTHASPRVWRI